MSVFILQVIHITGSLRPRVNPAEYNTQNPEILGFVGLAVALPPPTFNELKLEPTCFVCKVGVDFKITYCDDRLVIPHVRFSAQLALQVKEPSWQSIASVSLSVSLSVCQNLHTTNSDVTDCWFSWCQHIDWIKFEKIKCHLMS